MIGKQHEAGESPLHSLLEELDKLRITVGPAAEESLAAIGATLHAALAAWARGHTSAAMSHVATAMERLTLLAGQLDPREAAAMQAVTQEFRSALSRRDVALAKQNAAAMRTRSGALERPTR